MLYYKVLYYVILYDTIFWLDGLPACRKAPAGLTIDR